MGKIGFMFFAAVGIWVVTEGVGVDQPALAAWPGIEEMKNKVMAANTQMWQELVLEMLPDTWLP